MGTKKTVDFPKKLYNKSIVKKAPIPNKPGLYFLYTEKEICCIGHSEYLRTKIRNETKSKSKSWEWFTWYAIKKPQPIKSVLLKIIEPKPKHNNHVKYLKRVKILIGLFLSLSYFSGKTQTLNEVRKNVICSNIQYDVPQQTEDAMMKVLRCSTTFTGKMKDGKTHEFKFLITERVYKGSGNIQIVSASLLIDGHLPYSDIYGEPESEIDEDNYVSIIQGDHGFGLTMKGNHFIPVKFALTTETQEIEYDFTLPAKK
jgi:hypothetical protein